MEQNNNFNILDKGVNKSGIDFNKVANISVILAIISLLCCGGPVFSILALVLAVIALLSEKCTKKALAIIAIVFCTITMFIYNIMILHSTIEDTEDNKEKIETTSYTEIESTNSQVGATQQTETTLMEEVDSYVDTSTQASEIVEYDTTMPNLEQDTTESQYEFELIFYNKDNEFSYECTDATIQLSVFSKEHYVVPGYETGYYIRLPNGEYKLEYIGRDDYMSDQLGHLCNNTWVEYSVITNDYTDTNYTIENVPDDTKLTFYECTHYTVINKETSGKGRLCIDNGETMIINDSTNQLFSPFFDNYGNPLVKLCKLK